MQKIYVTMTDKFMSNWGRAKGLINKFIVECESWEDAEKIEYAAKKRREMKYINISLKKPYYNPNKYLVSFVKFDELGKIWTGK